MNRNKKNRIRCVNCIFCYDIHGKLHCEQEPKYVIDRYTRRPDWCPLRYKSKEVTDDQLLWILNKKFNFAVETETASDIQVNVNDFIPNELRGGYGLVESEET